VLKKVALGKLGIFSLWLAVSRVLGKMQIPHYQVEFSCSPPRNSFTKNQEFLWEENMTEEEGSTCTTSHKVL
jgi:hypothetical protein